MSQELYELNNENLNCKNLNKTAYHLIVIVRIPVSRRTDRVLRETIFAVVQARR